MEIFVTGATGAIGRPLTEALAAAGHEVVAGTRHPEAYRGPGRAVQFDLDAHGRADPGEAARTADAAFYLVHALDQRSFAQVDRDRAERFADLWGADRPVVYLGGLGEPGLGSPHLRSRHEVGLILRRRCETIELRAAMVLGAESISFQLLARLGRLASFSPLPVLAPQASRARTQPIGQADLVAALVHALELEPGSYDVGGPEVIRYADLMERAARAQGRTLKVLPVVPLDPEWIGPATSVAAGVDPWATSALFAGMGEETVVRPDHRVPGPELATTSIDDALAAALAGP
ncbi:NAD-dependent epimerase/dehydratase family protein [Aquihabitans sp. G128]|uniref:NAD-dependent epimerase/dehydratase family protein n=1 Tax=Aquihabitans sp. G128 TaxID=2849779 RepID=UPI001C22895B|nr:NAD-dependent epimerase/dehydratase family protein [Aquihabitans sp. G128]QXC61231.1 NAD-dependent epimerase/dehydratase family protein [Aquihabitans sp. G128]